jgi:hypothetical protein
VPWGDPEILEEIIRQSRSKFSNPRLRRIAQRAAVQTGLVESGGRNLNYGDADSQGWRQERASLYKNPTNISASVSRFLDEFKQHYDPGERSFEVAAQVQRPAAQYRGRYGDVRAEANRILRGARGGVQGAAPGAPNGTGALPGTSGPRSVPQGSEGLTALLASLAGEKPQVQSAGLQGPAHSAGAAMPGGYQAPVSGGGPQQRTDIAGLLSAIATVGGGVERGGMDPMAAAPAGGAPASRGSVRGGTAKSLADQIQSFAEGELGLTGGSRERTPSQNAAVGGSSTSDHLTGGGREAVDIPTTAANGGWEQYQKVARQIGLKPDKGGFTQGTIKRGGKRFRVQVIFGDAHGHGDHIHVGFRRA